MKRILLDNVKIGILDNNGMFAMSPLMKNFKIYFKAEQSECGLPTQILDYDIIDRNSEISVNITGIDGEKYKVSSFSDEYVEYINTMYFTLTELIDNNKEKDSSTGCKISNLSIITKFDGNEILMIPIEGLKLRGSGNVTGHKYLKGFGKTSKILDISSSNCRLTSKRNVYNILSISTEYKSYLENIIFELELILKRYSR